MVGRASLMLLTALLLSVLGLARQAPRGDQAGGPASCVQEPINTSEDLRRIPCEWERIWFTDQPSHLTPAQVQGDISDNTAASRPSSGWHPVPVMPWTSERLGDKYAQPAKADYRTVTIPPVVEAEPSDTSPDDAEILRVLPRLSPGLSFLCNVYRDEVQITLERIGNRANPPRCYPLIGPVCLHSCHWKCTVYHTEVIESAYPFPFRCGRPRIDVVYLDKEHLHLGGKDDDKAQTKHDPATGPTQRISDLIRMSEWSGPIGEPILSFWEWIWSLAPSPLTPERIHGGIQ